MNLNAIQRYLLKVYAIVIIALTIFVPIYSNSGTTSFSFILFGYSSAVNTNFLLIEYLAMTLALVASLFATSGNINKRK
jgi:hypothetical protein